MAHVDFYYSFIVTISLISSFLIVSITSSDRPDITLLRKQDRFVCVIGNNETDKAVVLATPLSDFSSVDSEYRNLDGIQVSKEYNCDFENGYNCVKNYTNKNWEIVETEDELLPIIHDIRFEKLPPSFTRNSALYFDMKEANFSFPFSVRADDEPQIIFCTDSIDIYTQCYWIRIEKNGRNTYDIAIRYCSKVHKRDFSLRDSACVSALPKNVDYPQVKNNLMILEWLHFIAIKNGRKLIFIDGLTKDKYFTLYDVDLVIKKIYFRTSENKKAEWKIHKNSHLKLKTFDNEVQLGPTFAKNNKMKFCISMMVHICKSCTLEIRINNEEKQEYYSNRQQWQNIKILSKTDLTQVKVFLKGTRLNNADHIGIDNVRLCHEKEFRLIGTNVLNFQEVERIYCKILNYPTWYASFSTPNSTIKICDDEKYIGKNCDLPCSAIFEGQTKNTEFCNKNTICQPSENIDKHSCVCASGYTGPNCDEMCRPNYFGYNCRNRCGECSNNQTCMKSSGICPQGCKIGFVTDRCTYKKYEPVDVLCESNDDGLINITWSHPKTTEYITIYTLLAKVLESEFSHNFSRIEKVVRFPFRQGQYTYVLEKPLPLSSSYTIEVCGDGKNDQCSRCNLTTPPHKPELQENFISEESISNDAKTIRIPGVVISTQNKNSSLFITVCNRTSETTNLKRKILEEDEIILSEIFCEQTSWVAGKIKISGSEVLFTVGDGIKSENIYENPPLENIYNNNYNICVVLMNEYKNLQSYNVYCEFDDGYDYFTNLVVGASVLGVVLLGIIIYALVCGIISMKSKNSRNENEEPSSPEAVPMNSTESGTRNAIDPIHTDL